MRRLVVRVAVVVALLITITARRSRSTRPRPTPRSPGSRARLTELPTRECAELRRCRSTTTSPMGRRSPWPWLGCPRPTRRSRIGSSDPQPGRSRRLRGRRRLPLMYAALPEPLRARFDVVGFDPRGVGQSAPVRCFDSIAERTAFFAAMPSVPIGAEEEAARQRAAEELARRCGERNADILPHLSTANVARDMDRLRQAVGDEQLTYLGIVVRHLSRRHLRQSLPRPRSGRWCSTGSSTRPPTPASTTATATSSAPTPPRSCASSATRGRPTRLQAVLRRMRRGRSRLAAPSPPRAPRRRARSSTPSWIACARSRSIAQGPAGTLTVTYSLVVDTVRGALYAAPLWSGLAQGLQRLEEGDAVGFLEATDSLGGPPPTDVPQHPGGDSPPATASTPTVPDDPDAVPGDGRRRAEERTPYFGAVWTYIVAAVCLLAGGGRRSLHGTVGRPDQRDDPPHQPRVRSGHAPCRRGGGRRDAGERAAADDRRLGTLLFRGRPQHLRQRDHGHLPHRSAAAGARHRLSGRRAAVWQRCRGVGESGDSNTTSNTESRVNSDASERTLTPCPLSQCAEERGNGGQHVSVSGSHHPEVVEGARNEAHSESRSRNSPVLDLKVSDVTEGAVARHEHGTE